MILANLTGNLFKIKLRWMCGDEGVSVRAKLNMLTLCRRQQRGKAKTWRRIRNRINPDWITSSHIPIYWNVLMSDHTPRENKASQIHDRFFKNESKKEDLKSVFTDQVSKDPDMALFLAVRKKVKSFIAKSSTDPENNKLLLEKSVAIFKGVTDVRSIRIINSFFLSENEARYMYNKIEAVKKYSFGNCLEYAILTFHLMWLYHYNPGSPSRFKTTGVSGLCILGAGV